MPDPTVPDAPVKDASPATLPAPEPGVPAALWALGDHSRQVLLAGLLVTRPELTDALQTPEKWQADLNTYAASERV